LPVAPQWDSDFTAKTIFAAGTAMAAFVVAEACFQPLTEGGTDRGRENYVLTEA
jgi:hypothetical protein